MKSTSSLKSRLGVILATAFALSMCMAVGPGVLLVNRPDMFLGLPLLYAWGIFWYVVIVAIALLAYRYVWCDGPDEDSERAT